MNPTTGAYSKKRPSLAKVFEASAIWAIVAGVLIWLIYKEIRDKQVEIKASEQGRTLVFHTDDLNGIIPRSPLLCQGITIGTVLATDAKPSGQSTDRLQISVTARLDQAYSTWNFKTDATVESSAVMSGLTGSSIQLEFAGQLSPQDYEKLRNPTNPQTLTLQSPESTGDLLRSLIADTRTILTALSKPVPPPEGWQQEQAPMQIEAIAHDLAKAAETLRSASNHLESELDKDTPDNLIATFRKIDAEFESLAANANSLLKNVDQTVTGIETKFDDTLGLTAGERARLRKEAERLLISTNSLMQQLDDLATRTGDTFIGRRIIRKDSTTTEEPPPPPPAARPVRRVGRR